MKTLNCSSKKSYLFIALSFLTTLVFSQTTVNIPFTGAPTQFIVPNCVTSLTITVAGAQGGNAIDGAGSTGSTGGVVAGGEGAVITATIPVNPGDILDINVGGQGGLGTPGYNGGGTGQNSTDGNAVNSSAGGGGSTNVNINGSPTIIAAGGGGAGGGSWSFGVENNVGGDGGCLTGQAPAPGSPWIGVGGGGGTQVGPGAGGAPWAGVPTGGFAGVGGTGGAGGIWQTAPGGGGGGGYFGGGGGGNDGCCTGANGAAGGGGGSSLIPGGAGCTQGANTGNGYVTITYTGGITATISDTDICEGEDVTLTLTGSGGTIIWQTAPTAAGPFVDIPGATANPYTTGPLTASACFRAMETSGITCGATPYSNEVCVTVHVAPNPNAGLDDTLCHTPGAAGAYPLQGVAAGPGTTSWSMTSGPLGTPSPPAAVFTPSASSPTANVNVNHPGMYTFTFSETDPTGNCPASTDQVNILFAKENHTTTFTDPICDNAFDGSITITSTGIPGAVEYSFDGGATFVPGNSSGFTLPEGTYTVISRDAAGCTFQSTVDLTDPAPVVINVSNDTTVCENGTATVSASATGGTSYLYHWNMTADLLAVQTISPTAPTTISVYAENELGCFSTTEDIEIFMHAPISISITPNDTICPGYDSNHQVTASGGHLGYNYSWTANGAPFGAATASIDVNPTSQTEYCVTVTDGCESTPQNICTITAMREVPNPVFITDTTQGCSPTIINFTNLTTLVAPAYIDSVTWNIGGVIYHDIAGLTHTFVEVGTYDVWFEVYTNYGCFNSILASDYIEVHGNPVANFYPNPNPTTIFNTEIDLNNTSTPGNNTYQWSMPGGNPVSSIEESPTVVYPQGYANNYQVTLIVTNEFTCTDTVTQIIQVQPDIFIFAPNVFTPDGDEFNETWRIYIEGIDIYDFHLTIFNRWGEIVWESYNPEGVWSGTYGSRGIVEDGTYVWVIEAKDKFSDKKVEWRGHVTVLK